MSDFIKHEWWVNDNSTMPPKTGNHGWTGQWNVQQDSWLVTRSKWRFTLRQLSGCFEGFRCQGCPVTQATSLLRSMPHQAPHGPRKWAPTGNSSLFFSLRANGFQCGFLGFFCCEALGPSGTLKSHCLVLSTTSVGFFGKHCAKPSVCYFRPLGHLKKATHVLLKTKTLLKVHEVLVGTTQDLATPTSRGQNLLSFLIVNLY